MRPSHEEISQYQMPHVDIGTPVVWYAKGERRGSEAEVGFVMHCGGRNVVLYTARGRRVDAVRHVDDPKLRLSMEQREMGAWDFTPESKRILALEQAVEDLSKQVHSLEQNAAKPKRNAKKGATPGQLSAWHKLQREAKDLGIDTRGKKKPQLLKEIADKRATEHALAVS